MKLDIPAILADRYARMSDRTGRLPEGLMLEALQGWLAVLDHQQRRIEERNANV